MSTIPPKSKRVIDEIVIDDEVQPPGPRLDATIRVSTEFPIVDAGDWPEVRIGPDGRPRYYPVDGPPPPPR